ncbi:hypothetical protein [Roseivivax isoporae]|uniref:Uncharacterized protein n=1 Tax=Roseivivax isoporae LMG 25204 TaxID=1449351 RepID=X7F465_9RHOB|nr:hypothetical protein [Roseivivax isoporae]ETX27575.1 hypothetical protein RISW2_13120 [Roseivivax isoporae LMG 25204]
MTRARRLLLPLLAVLALAGAATAQEAMTAAEFEAYVTGKTLYFGENGEAYGVETYLEDRRVRWSFLDGDCKDGIWYEDAGNICFVYEDNPVPQCWSFFRAEGGLRAVFENDPGQTVLYEARQDDAPMICHGPDVGV